MIKFMKEILDKLLSVILSLLPFSPFADAIDNLSQLPYLGYLNYFVPVGTFLKIGTAWLAATCRLFPDPGVPEYKKIIRSPQSLNQFNPTG